MKTIKDIKELSGKRVLVRLDLNVPIKDNKILDDFRIKKSIPTILFLQKKGAKVIIISHLGNKGTMKPVADRLRKYVANLIFKEETILSDDIERLVNNLNNGDVLLLENLRNEDGEIKNSPSFARALSRYADIYVNDAFSVSHRKHASVVGITKYLDGYAGLQMLEEVNNLSKVFNSPHPFLFILGGAKFDTKIPLIKKYAKNADDMFIGGALANDFFKYKGYEIGTSLVDDNTPEIKSLLKYKNIILPIDIEVNKGKTNKFVKPEEVHEGEGIVDIGPETIKKLEDLINKAKFILWNGPLGKYEDGFGGATEKVLKLIAKSKADSVIGGGDTVAIISKLKLEDKFGFVSTGGGATLEFLANGSLPGIKVLK